MNRGSTQKRLVTSNWLLVLISMMMAFSNFSFAADNDSKEKPSEVVAKRTTVTRKPVVQKLVEPVIMLEVKPGHYFIDFGKAWFGRFELVGVPDSEVGRKVAVHMGEMLDTENRVNREPPERSTIRYWNTEIVIAAGGKPQTGKMWGATAV